MAEIEQYLLECNYPKLERVVKRQQRAKRLSLAMEHFFAAEGEFASRLLSYRADQAEDAMEMPRFAAASSLEHAVHDLERALKHASPDERPIVCCALGKCLVFQKRYQMALDEVFGGAKGITDAEMVALFAITLPDPEQDDQALYNSCQEQGPLINSILGLQATYAKAVALEMVGQSREALVLYAKVTDFCRRFHRPAILKTPMLLLFAGMSMYRYGMLCTLFALDPRLLKDDQAEMSQISELRSRLLYDAAVALRLYLTFAPHAFGRLRHEVALTWYMSALEGRFRRSNYQKTFDPELAILGKGELACPATFAEDILTCTMVLESLQPPTPSSLAEAQGGSSSGRLCASMARLAVHGHWDGLVKLSHALFVRYAADASTYGRLIFALMAAGRHQKVIRAGEIYLSIGGQEPTVLLVFCQACLCYRAKSHLVIETVERFLPLLAGQDMSNPLRLLLGLAYLCRGEAGETFEEQAAAVERAVEVLEEAVVADETDPAAHFYLAVAYLTARKLKAAESSIAVSLSLEPDQPLAWTTFVLIKSALRNLETCIQTFSTFQDMYPFTPFLP